MTTPSSADLVATQLELFLEGGAGWLTFPGPLECKFEADSAPRRSQRMWLEGLISIVIFDAFFLVEALLLHNTSWGELAIQLGLVTPMALLVNGMVRMNPRKWMREGLVAMATCMIAGVYLWLQQNRNPVASAYGAVGIMVTAAFANVVMRLRFRYALVSSIVILSAGLTFLMQDFKLIASEKMLGGTLSAIAIGITLMANYSLERDERLGYLMRKRSELQRQDLELANAKLARLSAIDALTGLPNRYAYQERFEAVWNEAAETGQPLSVVVADIDHFKVLNDVRGHLYGDEVLRRVASLLLQALRVKADFAARFGGEEFVVLLPATGQESAMLVAERIRQLVEVVGSPAVENIAEESLMWVTVSCGVSTCLDTSGYRREELVEIADRALYEAKADGRNAVRWKEMERPGKVKIHLNTVVPNATHLV